MRRWFGLCALLIGCSDAAAREPDLGPPPVTLPTVSVTADAKINPRLLRRFRALTVYEPKSATEVAQISLGKQLFFDSRISQDNKTSCSSCHQLEHGGADGRAKSSGTAGKQGARNTPTVYNAARHVAQFWDGRAPSLESQAGVPILGETEMGMLEPKRVTSVLRTIKGYVPAFTAAFPGEGSTVDFEHATKAIAAFERTLITPSRWDRFLGGDVKALRGKEIEGIKMFADLGCVQCHTGDLIGGMMFQRTGLVVPWPNQSDEGRYKVTHDEADRMVFKVPSLRNVTLTAPYFHDGSVSDLREAVTLMAKHQLGIHVTDDEASAVVAWLGTLAGDDSTRSFEAPQLPI